MSLADPKTLAEQLSATCESFSINECAELRFADWDTTLTRTRVNPTPHGNDIEVHRLFMPKECRKRGESLWAFCHCHHSMNHAIKSVWEERHKIWGAIKNALREPVDPEPLAADLSRGEFCYRIPPGAKLSNPVMEEQPASAQFILKGAEIYVKGGGLLGRFDTVTEEAIAELWECRDDIDPPPSAT